MTKPPCCRRHDYRVTVAQRDMSDQARKVANHPMPSERMLDELNKRRADYVRARLIQSEHADEHAEVTT